MNEFTPKIIVFCCNWCSYAGADLAGVSRLQIAPHFRVVRTMCSGRIEPEFVLSAFDNGADGVMITGCHPGDCHYLDGNYKTLRRFYFLRALIGEFGVDTKRLRLHFISAGEGIEFQKKVNAFIDEIKRLGPAHAAVKESNNARK
jgi:F420-non-reducing hydrogenase iron-sulfur subunit